MPSVETVNNAELIGRNDDRRPIPLQLGKHFNLTSPNPVRPNRRNRHDFVYRHFENRLRSPVGAAAGFIAAYGRCRSHHALTLNAHCRSC